MPNSLTVSSRHRLPPASSAGSAAGKMTSRMMRNGFGAQARRHLDLRRVEQRKGRDQRPQHERRIDRHFRQHDAPGRIQEIDRRQVRPGHVHDRLVEEAGRAVDEREGERDQERGKRDERVEQFRDHRAPGKRHEGIDQGEREAEREAAGGRRQRDADGVEQRVDEHPRADHADEAGERHGAFAAGQGLVHDQRQGVEEDRRQHGERQDHPERGAGKVDRTVGGCHATHVSGRLRESGWRLRWRNRA